MSKNIFVTGATGFIGSHLVDRLIDEKYAITVLVRSSSNLQWLKTKAIKIVYGDLKNIREHSDLLSQQQYIVHVGGLVRASRNNQFFDINYESTKNLIELVHTTCKNLKKFIFLSSLEAGGPSGLDKIRDEAMKDKPITAYGKSKLLAEKALLAYKNKIPLVILRPPIVYGPRDIGLYELFKSIQKGIVISIGKKPQFASCIYIDDLIDTLLLCISTPIPSGSLFYISDSEQPHSMYDIQDSISKLLKKERTITLNIPKSLLWSVCACTHLIQYLTGQVFWLNLTRYKTFTQPYWTCSSLKLKKVINYEPKITILDGLKKTMIWYKKYNWI